MAIRIKDRICVKYASVTFNIELRSGIIAINGSSGTGKTFFRNVVKSVYENPDLIVALGWESANIIDIVLKEVSGKIVIIDNADLILFPRKKYRELFERDTRNQYIIYTRFPSELGITRKQVALLREKGDNIIETFYSNITAY